MLEMMFATKVAKRCCALRTQTQTNKDLLSQVLICLAVTNNLDATLFFQKKDYFSRFSNKIFLFFKTDT